MNEDNIIENIKKSMEVYKQNYITLNQQLKQLEAQREDVLLRIEQTRGQYTACFNILQQAGIQPEDAANMNSNDATEEKQLEEITSDNEDKDNKATEPIENKTIEKEVNDNKEEKQKENKIETPKKNITKKEEKPTVNVDNIVNQVNKIDEKDIPDYLKEEYNLK